MGIIKETVCIVAPETPYGAPPGWTQPLPLGPKEYNEILRSVLTPAGTEAVPAVNVTDKRATLRCAEDEDSTWYVNDYENWPEHANR